MSEPEAIDFESYVSQHIVPGASKAAGVPLLMLQCMDSRYPHRTIQTMDSMGLRGKYDQLTLAGASLGIVHQEAWQTTFLDQLVFAIEHHHVTQVLILDHRDCGAYKHFLGVGPENPQLEKDAHITECNRAIAAIREARDSGERNELRKLEWVRCLLLPIETVDQLVVDPL